MVCRVDCIVYQLIVVSLIRQGLCYEQRKRKKMFALIL